MHNLLIDIHPPVKFKICSFNTKFHCFRCYSNHFGFIYKKNDVHYLLNSIYLDVKFQMCSFNNVQVIARFIYFLKIVSLFPFPLQPFFDKKNKKSDLHYFLNGIYPTVKFQMVIFNNLRVIAKFRFFYISTISFP